MRRIFSIFYESVEQGLHDIHRIYLRRSHFDIDETLNNNIDMHLPYHIENATLLVAVNGDGDYKGGELFSINSDSPYQVRRPAGKAIVNPSKAVQGVAPFQGTRYTLFFRDNPDQQETSRRGKEQDVVGS